MSDKITPRILYGIVMDLVSLGPRITGSDAERSAADYIVRAFDAAGLERVATESFQIRSYDAQTPTLIARAKGVEHVIPACAIWYTEGGTVTAPAIDMGMGTPGDFSAIDPQGKVAVVQSRVLLNYYPTHSMLATYRQAEAVGAAAYIAWIDAPFDLAPRYNHLKEDHPSGKIPGLLLSRGDGMFLQSLLDAHGEALSLEVSLDATETWAETGDVVGYLPGTDDVIIIGSHYDSVFDGAVDNAAANAGLIALAHWAAERKETLPTLIFCAHPGHEVNVGAREFVKNHTDEIDRAFLYFSLDGFASSGFSWNPDGVIPTGGDEKRAVSVSDNPLLLSIAIDAIRTHRLLPAAYVPASNIIFNRDLEGRFYELGVPTLMVIGKPIWYHTRQDTADKVTPDQLYRSFLAHADILEGVIKAGPDKIRAADRSTHEDVIGGFLQKEARETGSGDGTAVSFGCLPEPARAGEPTLFFINDFAHGGDVVVDIVWDFGDGDTARGPVLPHTYTEPGRKVVRLSMIDASGRTAAFERVLWVI